MQVTGIRTDCLQHIFSLNNWWDKNKASEMSFIKTASVI